MMLRVHIARSPTEESHRWMIGKIRELRSLPIIHESQQRIFLSTAWGKRI